MSGDPWIQPQGPWDQQMQSRLVGPAEVRSVMFATTRMKVGYEVSEVDAFLDRVEMSMEHMIGEIQSLRRRIAATDQSNEARMYDIRLALEQLLVHLGGPTGQPSGVIDPSGQEVPLFPGMDRGRFGPPQGPVNASDPPMSRPAPADPVGAPGFSANGVPPGGFPAPGAPPAAPGFGSPVTGPPRAAAPHPTAAPGYPAAAPQPAAAPGYPAAAPQPAAAPAPPFPAAAPPPGAPLGAFLPPNEGPATHLAPPQA